MPFIDRIRLGLLTLNLQRRKEWASLEQATATEWLLARTAGNRAYDDHLRADAARQVRALPRPDHDGVAVEQVRAPHGVTRQGADRQVQGAARLPHRLVRGDIRRARRARTGAGRRGAHLVRRAPRHRRGRTRTRAGGQHRRRRAGAPRVRPGALDDAVVHLPPAGGPAPKSTSAGSPTRCTSRRCWLSS